MEKTTFLQEGKSCFHSKDLSGELFYIQEGKMPCLQKLEKVVNLVVQWFPSPTLSSVQFKAVFANNITQKIGGLLSAAFRSAPHHPNLYLLEGELFRKTSRNREENFS